MVVSASTSSMSSAQPIADSASRQRSLHDDQRRASEDGLVAPAFDAVLAGVKVGVTVASRGGSRHTSPNQMFEASSASAHEQRQGAMRRDFETDLRNTHDPRLERANVDARLRTALEGPGQPTVRRNASAKTNSPDSTAARAPIVDSLAVSRPPLHGEHNNRLMLTPTNPTSMGGAAGERTIDVRAASSANPPPTPVDSLASTAASAMAPTAGGGVTQTPAAQVGELLSVTRIGEVESARAASAPAAAGQTKSASRGQQGQARPAPAREQESGGEARRAESGDKKPGEALRSTYDDLVRSIRLRLGARQSSARIHLHPPELGRVRVDVRLEGEEVRIDVRTENNAARELLAERADRLAAALEEHGIRVRHFEVRADSAEADAFEHDDDDRSSDAGSEHRADRGSSMIGNRESTSAVPSLVDQGDDVQTSDDGPTDSSDLWAARESRLDIRV